jgi:TM2 domain
VTSGSLSRYQPEEPPEPRAARPLLSERSRGVALGLSVVGGLFGLHRFYVGRVQSGIWMCLTMGGLGIWYVCDIIVVAAGDFRDSDGRRVARWEVSDDVVDRVTGTSSSERRVSDLEDRMLGLESQVGELAERLDFAERLLAQARERGSLPKA